MTDNKAILKLQRKFSNFFPKNAIINKNILSEDNIINICNKRNKCDKPYINIKHIDFGDNINEIYDFLENNFFTTDTFVIKMPIELLRVLYDKCYVLALYEDSELASILLFSKKKLQVNNEVIESLIIHIINTNKKHRKKKYATMLLENLQYESATNNIVTSFYLLNALSKDSVSKLKYFYRPLNPQELLNAGFSGFHNKHINNNNDEKIIEYYTVQQQKTLLFKKASSDDINMLFNLYEQQRERYNISVIYTIDEFNKLLINDNISTFCIVEDEIITDFVSYYKIQHLSVKNKNRKNIDIANLFVYSCLNNNLFKIIKNLLVHLVEQNVDMLCVMNNMNNEDIIDTHKFIDSNTYLSACLYNYCFSDLNANQIGSFIFI